VEQDSPSSRTTKSSFIGRMANFALVSPFSSMGQKHIFRAYPSNPKIAELSEALGSAFSLFEEQEQALSAYCLFPSFLTFQKTLHCTRNNVEDLRFGITTWTQCLPQDSN